MSKFSCSNKKLALASMFILGTAFSSMAETPPQEKPNTPPPSDSPTTQT